LRPFSSPSSFSLSFSQLSSWSLSFPAPLLQSPSIVKYFDIVKDLDPSLLTREIVPAMNEFHFQRVEEAFCYRVVPAIPSSTHTALDPRSFQDGLKRLPGVLDALIGMMAQPSPRSTVCGRHREGGKHQLLSHPLVHRPAHDFPMIQI
jgi:hypothetical protein